MADGLKRQLSGWLRTPQGIAAAVMALGLVAAGAVLGSSPKKWLFGA